MSPCEVVGLLAVRDGERHLAAYLDHLRPYVDGFVVVDDASSDSTPSLLAREPKLLALQTWTTPAPEHFRESQNHFELATRAGALGARWALLLDVDERGETQFLAQLRAHCREADARGMPRMSVAFRELWDRDDQYRVDGIWGKKRREVAYRVPASITARPDGQLHAPRYPPELDSTPVLRLDRNVYHLHTLEAQARAARRAKFERLDPRGAWQRIGYAYLTDDANLALERIPPGRGY